MLHFLKIQRPLPSRPILRRVPDEPLPRKDCGNHECVVLGSLHIARGPGPLAGARKHLWSATSNAHSLRHLFLSYSDVTTKYLFTLTTVQALSLKVEGLLKGLS